MLYPRYSVRIFCKPTDGVEYEGPITVAIAKKLLKWETESEYTARMMAANPGTKENKWKFGDNYLLKVGDEKVRCWNNSRNRPFDETHAKEIAQDILTLDWMMNLENIIIGRTGLVLSGQHRLIGLILAAIEWAETKPKGGKGYWEENWPEEPYMESTIAFGAHETQEVLRTYDNVKTRTLSDTVYTSPIFDSIKDQGDKKECCRMMDFAVDCLWKRTRQVEGKNSWVRYQTHSRSLDFADRHKKLEKCVKHIFDNNRNRVLSKLGLSAGECGAMMYLMASSATDPENYHYAGSSKKESQLNFDNWDKAVEFWSGLVDKDETRFNHVHKALGDLKDVNKPIGKILKGSAPQKVKQMILAKAWNEFVADNPITYVDLDLAENIKWSDQKERPMIVLEPTVGGIDCGVVKGGGEKEDEIPTPEEQAMEAERLKEEDDKVKAARAEELKQIAQRKKQEALNKAKAEGKPFTDEERAAEVERVTAMGKKGSTSGTKTPPRPSLKPKK